MEDGFRHDFQTEKAAANECAIRIVENRNGDLAQVGIAQCSSGD